MNRFSKQPQILLQEGAGEKISFMLPVPLTPFLKLCCAITWLYYQQTISDTLFGANVIPVLQFDS